MENIRLVKGDITKMTVDAIVNAANSGLRGGGGVDGAIHRAGGPTIMDECRKIGRCPTGEAVITTAGQLPAKFVIHTVGPIWQGGTHNEGKLLSDAYQNSLKLAKKHNVKSIAFPNISTGVYGFPKKLAASIAAKTIRKYIHDNQSDMEVTFICFDDENYSIYKELLS